MHSHSFLLDIVATPTPHIAMGNVTPPSRRLWCLVLNVRSRFLDRYYNIVRQEIWIRWKSWRSLEMKIHKSVSFIPSTFFRFRLVTVFFVSRLSDLLSKFGLSSELWMQVLVIDVSKTLRCRDTVSSILSEFTNVSTFTSGSTALPMLCNLDQNKYTKRNFWKFQKWIPVSAASEFPKRWAVSSIWGRNLKIRIRGTN